MKKHTLIKLLCIVLFSLMVVSLASCGGAPVSSETETEEKTVTVTFDAGEGAELDEKDATATVKVGGKITKLPKPTKEGFTFKGWSDGKNTIKAPYSPTKDITLEAIWQADDAASDSNTDTGTSDTNADSNTNTDTGAGDSNTDTSTDKIEDAGNTDTNTDTNKPDSSGDTNTDTSTQAPAKVTLTFDANGGTIVDGDASREATPGKTFRLFPTVEKEGYTFVCWLDENDDEIGESITVPSVDTTYTAYWKKNASSDSSDTDTNTSTPASKVTLTFDPNGGTIVDGEASREATPGKTFRFIPTVEKEGYTFVCWVDEDGEEVATPITVPSVDTTYTAYWQKNSSSNPNDSSTETQKPQGPTVLITLDANGGTLPANTQEEFEAEVGSQIGKLPTPTKAGYTFLGWFEDGNEKWEVDRKTEVEDYDMVIVALWEAKGDLVMVEFVMGTGETLSIDTPYFEMVEGERISGFLSALPTATKEGYKFKNWQDKEGNQVTVTAVINADTQLFPVWVQVVLCHDGTENHQWNAWQEASEATCTTPSQNSRVCNVCGHTEYNTIKEALGHKFGNWVTAITESGIVRSRTCVECDEKEADPLTNIAFDAFKTPIVDGDCWGGDKGANLFDGNYNDKPIAGKGTGALTVTTEAKEAVYVDIIAVTGHGASAYTVTVFFDDGTSKDIGVGAFGSGESATKAFTVGKMVTKIVVTQPSPSNGTDFWSEISILVVPKAGE